MTNLKNLKDKDYLLKWLKASAIRALKTFAQSALSMITVGAAFEEIKWPYVASVAGVAAVYSILTSIVGIPEVEPEDEGADDGANR